MLDISRHERRSFIKNLGVGALGAFVLGNGKDPSREIPSDWSELSSLTEPDESYWRMVKNQFSIKPGMTMVNSANLCPCPRFVNQEVEKYSRALASDVSFQYRAIFGERRNLALDKLGHYFNVPSSTIGITRNTSEANNIVVNGLDLKNGEEVVIWEQNHPSNHVTWRHRSKRHGFTVKTVSVPTQPMSQQDLIRPFQDALTERTRVIAFSHISNVSGIALPVKEICKMATERNILTLIDGAQTVGCLDLDLNDLGCSYYTSSTHKWLMGPMENGILYVNPAHRADLWPNIIAAGWDEKSTSVDDKLCILGQRNNPSTAVLPDIIDFHMLIGKSRIEKRVKFLNTYLKQQLKARITNISFVTPVSEELSGGVTIFSIPDTDSMKLFQDLYSDHGIACAPTGGVRISPTIHSTISDIDKVVDAVDIVSKE